MSGPYDLTGYVVTSRAGRDKDRSFLVVGMFGADYVLLADGTLRKLSNPKKKKLKHVTIEKDVAEGIKVKLSEGKQVFDAEIRNTLIHLGYNTAQQD